MNHKRHAAHCTVCQHPELKAIEARFLDWESPRSLEISYGLPQTFVYRHAKAFNLYETRQDNVLSVLERLIERGVEQLLDITTTNLIEATDDASAPRVIVANEALVPFLPEGNPIGTRIHHVGSAEWLTIVGVVKSLRHSSLLQPQRRRSSVPISSPSPGDACTWPSAALGRIPPR